MQTQDSQLREIQAGNEEVRKKLQVFRSGLQKLMSKKSSKKSQRHEPPCHDSKKPYLSQQSQYQYKSNSPIQQSPQQGNKLQQSQFGFNSTLFRQLNDQTVLSNNSSGVNEFYKQQNGQYDNNYGSVGSLNSQKGGQYYSTSTKKSQQVYSYQSFNPNINPNGINNNNGDKAHYQFKQPQSFKKSSLLFSEIDQLMNRVNKSSKLPVKPIQKYINQQQNKLISESKQIDLSLSNSSLILNSDQNRGKPQFQQLRKKEKPFQDNNTKRSLKKEQNPKDKVSVKQSLRQTGNFLKNMKQRSSSIQSMKQPPLPPPQSFVNKPLNSKSKQQRTNRDQGEDFLEWGRKISQRKVEPKGQYQQNEQQQQRRQQIMQQKQQIRGQQKIANMVKSTINERKKLMKQDHLMDDSIELQLSSQQQQQQQNNKNGNNIQGEQNSNKVTLIQIKILQQQKQLLLHELNQIQGQLQYLQSQL